MVTPIYLLTGELKNHEKDSVFTGWYGIKRLRAEGPYESIVFSRGEKKYIPDEGPLARTESDMPSIWCALLEGKIIISPKTDEAPPPLFRDQMQIRGYYDLDRESNRMIWNPIGAPWDENEIEEFRQLSNPSYQLYSKAPLHPEYVFFFGAGASFGSDAAHLVREGNLPPLGRDLFAALHKDPLLKYWNEIPKDFVELFQTRPFEEAMDFLEENKEWEKESVRRDLDLVRFFARFRPLPSNLYWKLAKAISRKLKNRNWTGASITLNYDRLLEESFMRNSVFTVVKGVTYYDDNLPILHDNQLFEICYPHGACQFFLGQNWLKIEGEGNIVFGKNASSGQTGGVNHILKYQNIPKACDMFQFPMICRYQPSKRPTVGKNYFIDNQQDRCSELIANAKLITIIGVYCSHPTDKHLWEPLGTTNAYIVYVNSSKDSQSSFKEWASQNGKIDGMNYRIISKTFKDAFQEIMKMNEIL